jgi:polyisoprenoid-binding protein YceI
MRDTLDASRFPFVVFKGVTSVIMPAAQGTGIPTTMQGELEFHGVKQQVQVPVTLQFASDGSARVSGKMKLSLDSFRIDRPSLLMIKLDDQCDVEFDLKLKRD